MRKHGRKLKKQRRVIIGITFCMLFLLTVGYAAFQTHITITAEGNIKDKSSVIQKWEYTSQSDFHTDYYKENIVSATFLDNADVPSSATESWNVSEDTTHGGVMAWVIPTTNDSTKYDLYIGAKDGVIANVDSGHLFCGFNGIQSIDFKNNFDTSNVTNMWRMFLDCQSLTNLNLSNFDTSKVVNMDAMFSACSSIEIIDVSSFDTSNAINMRSMFDSWSQKQGKYIDTSLKQIIFSEKFNTHNVMDMTHMFHGQKLLEELNLCSFDTSSVKSMGTMFYGTINLQNIYVGPNWTTENADITQMFTNSGVSEVTTGQCG